MKATLGLRRTSSSPDASNGDGIRLFSERDVLIVTSAEERDVDRSGDRVWEGKDFA